MSIPPIPPNHTSNSQPELHTPPTYTSTHAVSAVAQQTLQAPPTSRPVRHIMNAHPVPTFTDGQHNAPQQMNCNESLWENIGRLRGRCEQILRRCEEMVSNNPHTSSNRTSSQRTRQFANQRTRNRDLLASQGNHLIVENLRAHHATVMTLRRYWDRSETAMTKIKCVHIHDPNYAQLQVLRHFLPRTLHERYNQRTNVIAIGEKLYKNFHTLYPELFPSIWPRN